MASVWTVVFDKEAEEMKCSIDSFTTNGLGKPYKYIKY